MKSILAITLSIASAAYAQTLTEFASSWWDKVSTCHSQCNSWVNTVNTCVSNLNQTYSVSVNPSDVGSFSHSGDLGAVGNCLCSNEAVGASDGCLVCVSQKLCLKQTLSQSDYQQTCRNPMYAWNKFMEWHSHSFCQNEQGSGSGAGALGNSNGGNQNGAGAGAGGALGREHHHSSSSSAASSSSTPCSSSSSMYTRRR